MIVGAPPAGGEYELALLDDLLAKASAYRNGADYQEALDFICRMRHMAPFNAALIHIQKPNVTFVATWDDWRIRFRRDVRDGARPLLIMWPFAPVALVYEVEDTYGEPLPLDLAEPFRAYGDISIGRMAEFVDTLKKVDIACEFDPLNTMTGGFITIASTTRVEVDGGRPRDDAVRHTYRIVLNASHDPNTQFATLVHELGHLFLGHLGPDHKLKIAGRSPERDVCEIEAEMAAYLVCHRQGVRPLSERYLAEYTARASVSPISLYNVTQAAGRIERVLKLAAVLKVGLDQGR